MSELRLLSWLVGLSLWIGYGALTFELLFSQEPVVQFLSRSAASGLEDSVGTLPNFLECRRNAASRSCCSDCLFRTVLS